MIRSEIELLGSWPRVASKTLDPLAFCWQHGGTVADSTDAVWSSLRTVDSLRLGAIQIFPQAVASEYTQCSIL